MNETNDDQQVKPSTTMIRQNQNNGGGAAANSVSAAALPTITSLSSRQMQSSAASSSTAITLSPDQVAKLNSELDIVECNVQVFNDVINELTQTQTQNKNLDDYNGEIELLRVISFISLLFV